jgi:amino acid adenylation domain-containing protein
MINSVANYLENSTLLMGDKIALITREQHLTYNQLLKAARKLAGYFREQGVRRGDRVVVSTGNCAETVIVFWATLLADAVISIIDPSQSSEKSHYIVNDAGARAFIIQSDKQHSFLSDKRSLPQDLLVINLDDDNTESMSKILARSSDVIHPYKHLDLDLASIIYTSGSTGEPKGVMLTHRNMLAASQSINNYLHNTQHDIVISALPLSFDYGLYQMIMMIAVGGTLILENNFILPSRFLKLIEQYRPTAVPVVPSMVPLLEQYQQLKKQDVSSVRYVSNTGAALMGRHILTLQHIFSKAEIYSMYGLTECKRCSYVPPHALQQKINSVGIPIPNTEMWIIDDSGNRLAPHQVGQIVVRGQTVMKGYWNKPDLTKQKLKPGLIPGEYILHTGDQGMMDEDGYFYFYGRTDEVIKSRGLKVSPREIETTLLKNSYIHEAAAVAVNHEHLGQAIVLFVSSNQQQTLTVKEVQIYCKAQLASHQQPIDIVILTHLPKTSNGKIDKRLLTYQYANASNATVASA